MGPRRAYDEARQAGRSILGVILALGALAILQVVQYLTGLHCAPVMVSRMCGPCMEPTLRHNNIVLAIPGKPAEGRIVVARVPGQVWIKRVQWVGGEPGHRPRLFAAGDNTWESECRYVYRDQVAGVVAWRLWPCNQRWREAQVPLRVYSPQQYQERLREVTEELIRKEEAARGKDQHNSRKSLVRHGEVPEPQAGLG